MATQNSTVPAESFLSYYATTEFSNHGNFTPPPMSSCLVLRSFLIQGKILLSWWGVLVPLPDWLVGSISASVGWLLDLTPPRTSTGHAFLVVATITQEISNTKQYSLSVFANSFRFTTMETKKLIRCCLAELLGMTLFVYIGTGSAMAIGTCARASWRASQ